MGATLPWAVAGIAFLALFAMLAGKGFNAKRGSSLDAPATALPNPALDGPMAGGNASGGASMDGSADDGSMGGGGPFSGAMGGAGGANGGIRAPDISKMDPSEIAERLFNRVMTLNSQGKSDSVQFFAPMAIQAYSMLVARQGHPLDLDQRYDVGRIAEAAGAIPLAKAQADTILQQRPKHLLGLLLAARVAKASGNTPSYQSYAHTFQQAKAAELAAALPEYAKHRDDITAGP